MTAQDREEFRAKGRRIELVLIGVVLGVIAILFIRGCSGGENPKAVTVKVPEAKGSFKQIKPNNAVIHTKDIVYLKSKELKGFSPEYVARLISENQELSRIYRLQNDSVKKGLYEKAIQLNTFNQKFEDSLARIDVHGISRGTVESLGVDYVIKDRKIQIPQKLVKFRLLGGVSVSNDIQLQKPLFKANIGFQNKRGNVLRIGYDSEKRISVGYDLSIFKIQN